MKEGRKEGSNKHNHFTVFFSGICPKPNLNRTGPDKTTGFWLRPVKSYIIEEQGKLEIC